MSYNKTDGKMKEGHIHINDDGTVWIVKNQKFVLVEEQPYDIQVDDIDGWE